MSLDPGEQQAISVQNALIEALDEAHTVLDEEGIPRYSANDEMPPDVELSLAERIRRLGRRVSGRS